MALRYIWTHFDSDTLSWTVRQIGTDSVLHRSRYFDELENWGKSAAQNRDTVFFLIGFENIMLAIYFNGNRYK